MTRPPLLRTLVPTKRASSTGRAEPPCRWRQRRPRPPIVERPPSCDTSVVVKCLAGPDSAPELQAVSRWWRYEPNMIFQPSVITSAGHQIHGVPDPVMRATRFNDVQLPIIELVLEYGTPEQAGAAKALQSRRWGVTESWTQVETSSVWIPTRLVPARGPSREATEPSVSEKTGLG